MHDLLYIQRGRNYAGPVREVLARVHGQGKAVLDLGCEILDLVELRNDRRMPMPILDAVQENGAHLLTFRRALLALILLFSEG